MVTWLIILPFTLPIKIVRDKILELLVNWTPSIGYIIIIVLLQNVLCRFAILQDPAKNTAIDNRKLYHLFAYFFYLNVSQIYHFIIVGMKMFVIRIYLLDLDR